MFMTYSQMYDMMKKIILIADAPSLHCPGKNR